MAQIPLYELVNPNELLFQSNIYFDFERYPWIVDYFNDIFCTLANQTFDTNLDTTSNMQMLNSIEQQINVLSEKSIFKKTPKVAAQELKQPQFSRVTQPSENTTTTTLKVVSEDKYELRYMPSDMRIIIYKNKFS